MNKFVIVLVLGIFLLGCTKQNPQTDDMAKNPTQLQLQDMPYPTITREEALPSDIAKMVPQADVYPPQLHLDEFENPVPMGSPVNTLGAEDSPFITPDGNMLYFFFTPDVRVPIERQISDNVTGIYVSKKQNGVWGEPKRVWLNAPGKVGSDGCEFISGGMIYFCSVREGYEGINWFFAELKEGNWVNWQYAGDSLKQKEYEVGELHMSKDGRELYFHSSRAGGKGEYDIWVSKKIDGIWQEPENIGPINSQENDGWPYLSQDGRELWFTRVYLGSPAIFRSKKANGQWSEPELVVSQFAGEPTLDDEGNLYFVHHFYKDSKMIEADIYFAKKK